MASTFHNPLLSNFATTSNNLSISIQRGKQKLPVLSTFSFYATNLSHHQTNASPFKHTTTTTTTDLDFEDRTTRFRVKGLVQRIIALSSSNRKTEMLQILEKDPEFQTISDFNHLLMALIIAQHPDMCLTLFTNLPSYQLVPDSCTYSIMVRCYCKKNNLDEAKKTLDTILDKGYQPNAAIITVLIDSLCKRGKIQKALEVFRLMSTKGCNWNPSVQAHNCLLKGLCYVGKVEEALEVLMGMKEKTPFLKPDVYSYTAVMDGLCKVGRSDESMELLNEAVGMGIIPNVVTFNTLLQGYSREGRPMEGVAVLKLMKKHGCAANYINYSTVLHGLLKWNEVETALGIYKEMVGLGFEVDLRMMGTLVRRLCRKSRKERGLIRDAWEVFEKMKERESMVDQRTLEVMVQALCGRKKVDEALEVLNDMVRMGYSPGAITFEKVIQGLCARGRVEEAVSTLLLLCANGRVPKRISCDVLIKELNAQGRLVCASNLFGYALKQGVVLSREPLPCKCYEEG